LVEKDEPGSPTWFSAVEDPVVVSDAADIAWQDEADFVVVGYGGAGVAAAVEAAEQGLSVIAIDRYHGGGATAMNGGVVYLGGGTKTQIEAGVEDSPNEMFKYLQLETEGVVSDRTLRKFCDESPAMHDWLEKYGVRFNSTLYRKKTSYPNSTYYLYHSDSSLAPAYAAIAKPAARGHRVYMPAQKTAVGYGVGLYGPLKQSAEKLGVRLMAKAEARKLVLDREGRVLGVVVLQIPPGTPEAAEHERLERKGTNYLLMLPPAFPGAGITNRLAAGLLAKARAIEEKYRVARFVRARRGVCLSSGGFIFNRAMVEHYAPKYAAGMPLGSPGDDGSGIRLGQTAGGAVDRLYHVSAWRFINPPLAWSYGMIVNAKGARYVNEMLYGAMIGLKMCEDQDGKAYVIVDQKLYREAWAQIGDKEILPFQKYPAMMQMWFGRRKGRTLADLAKKCGFDPETLRQTVDAYNRIAAGEGTDPFGKTKEDMEPITEGPFYAIDVSADAKLAPLPTLTLGGLKVDEETGQVLRESGTPVAGLYAAGRTAIGICSNIYVSGLSASDCIFSGRRAAQHAATAGA
jgi:3-oxo-5alpha-steroid 4-dehydrogenase